MVPFLTPEYRNISQESGVTLLGIGINMSLKGWTPIHYNDCKVEEGANGISSWSSCRTNYCLETLTITYSNLLSITLTSLPKFICLDIFCLHISIIHPNTIKQILVYLPWLPIRIILYTIFSSLSVAKEQICNCSDETQMLV